VNADGKIMNSPSNMGMGGGPMNVSNMSGGAAGKSMSDKLKNQSMQSMDQPGSIKAMG
jgi:hypothetical protein